MTKVLSLGFVVVAVGCAAPEDSEIGTGDDAVDDLGTCAMDLVVGRCGLADSLADCAGTEGEEHVFVPIEEGEELGIVYGYQGARMFALAARTEGIDPGNPHGAPSENDPLVDATLYRSSYSVVGRFRTWMAFEDHEDEHLELREVYVQLDPSVASGQELEAEIRVTDADGVSRCGSVGFFVR